MAFSEVIDYQQIQIKIELVCVAINFWDFYSRLVKDLHYYCNLKVIMLAILDLQLCAFSVQMLREDAIL